MLEVIPVGLLILLAGALGFSLYFLPALVANHRKLANQNTYTALNLLLGWSGVVWIVLLIVALCAEKPGSQK